MSGDIMELPQWIGPALTLIGGGAAGSIITAAVTSFRNRVQPVGFRAEPVAMFRGTTDQKGVNLKVALESDGKTYEFPNLHAIDVEISNNGNADRASFEFGLTLSSGDTAVFFRLTKLDRHHVFTSVPDISPTQPSIELDFIVAPFNRGDRYRFTIYVTIPVGNELVGTISFSSPHAVRFTPMPTVGEFGMQIVKAVTLHAISAGGIQIKFVRNPPFDP